jgi:xanthine dehydrogenase YagS FAD-binding subunit
MRPFTYVRAAAITEAINAIGNGSTKYLAGGTNLIDLMRAGAERPDRLIDVCRLPLAGIYDLPDGGLRLGATTRLSHVAMDLRVRRRYPMLARAILLTGSPQLRNMATVGGNLMQRTRCPYFYDQASACNKRQPGRGCDAIGGFNRMHAILGASGHCIAVHPSDMCVALAALNAIVQVEGQSERRRTIRLIDLHCSPGNTPHIESVLAADELITSIDLPPTPRGRSLYIKVRNQASSHSALVSLGALLDVIRGRTKSARVVLGGVAPKPWRSQVAEDLLVGQLAEPEVFHRAADEALREARTHTHNAFKLELAKRVMVRTLEALTASSGDPS